MAELHEHAGGTRAEVLRRLRRGGASVPRLAAELGVTPNAVRLHVTALERDGLVRVGAVDRDTGGKPARLYELTEAAEESFPKAYAAVLLEALEALKERQGVAAVEELLALLGTRLAAGAAPSGRGTAARVEAAAAALRALGADVEVVPGGAGWRIQGHGCPLSAVVREEPLTCKAVEALVIAVSGLEVHERCARGAHVACAFELERAR